MFSVLGFEGLAWRLNEAFGALLLGGFYIYGHKYVEGRTLHASRIE